MKPCYTRERSGITLAETMVAAGILLVLVTATFAVFRVGSRALRKSEGQARLLSSLQLVTERFKHDATGAIYGGESFDNSVPVVSVLSGLYADGSYAVDNNSRSLIPQRYIVYYLNSGKVFRREVEIGSAPATSQPLELQTTIYGLNPLPFYATGGRAIAENIYSMSLAQTGKRLSLSLKALDTKTNRDMPDAGSLESVVLLRN